MGGSRGKRKLEVETRIKLKVAIDEIHRKAEDVWIGDAIAGG